MNCPFESTPVSEDALLLDELLEARPSPEVRLAGADSEASRNGVLKVVGAKEGC
jgi:hypothetical protein